MQGEPCVQTYIYITFMPWTYACVSSIVTDSCQPRSDMQAQLTGSCQLRSNIYASSADLVQLTPAWHRQTDRLSNLFIGPFGLGTHQKGLSSNQPVCL